MCGFLQGFDASAANAARREIDHSGKSRIVVRVADQPQVSERVFDFLTIEKAQSAINAIRHACGKKLVFEHARLRVGAVEQGDLRARKTVTR